MPRDLRHFVAFGRILRIICLSKAQCLNFKCFGLASQSGKDNLCHKMQSIFLGGKIRIYFKWNRIFLILLRKMLL